MENVMDVILDTLLATLIEVYLIAREKVTGTEVDLRYIFKQYRKNACYQQYHGRVIAIYIVLLKA